MLWNPTGRRRSAMAPGAAISASASGSPNCTASSRSRSWSPTDRWRRRRCSSGISCPPGDRVIVEQPTYDRTLLLLRQAGAELVGAPLEADGVDPAAVEAACGRWRGEARPHHSQLPQPGRLHALAREASRARPARGGPRLPALRGRPLPPDQLRGDAGARRCWRWTRADRVIHASSFSKSVSPGVRVGYLVGPTEQIATLAKRANETYISPNMLAESIVFELCRSGGLDENLKVVNAALRERRDALVDALREHIPEATVRRPRGRLLPLARPERRRRHQGPAGRGEGGGRHLRRRAPTS